MTRRSGIIFDIDGVLVDSYHAHFRSWQALGEELGRTYSEEDFARGFGRTSREVIVEQWGGETLGDERIRELDQRKEAIYREMIAVDVPEMPGARSLVEDLHTAGFAVALGSSGPRDNVELVIDLLRIRPFLGAAITGSDVTRGKPDPQVFQLAAERLELSPDRCVVVEDATAGVQAAHAAGMKCIGVASTGRSAAELAEAELVIDTLSELTVERFSALIDPSEG